MYVQPSKWDVVSKETLKLAHAWFTGSDIVKAYRRKNPDRKVVGVTFPVSEPVYAMGAVPLFMLRNEKFEHKGINQVLGAITKVIRIFGWNSLDKIVKLAFFTRAGSNLVEGFIDNLIGALMERYAAMTKLADDLGFPRDSCFASRCLYGLLINNNATLDAFFNYSYRCAFLYKFNDSMGMHVDNNFILDIPASTSEKSVRMVEEELMDFFHMMEDLTGNRFKEENLANVLSKTNELKVMYKEFLYGTCTDDILPYRPLIFAYIQFLIMFSFIDYNSNLNAFYNNFKRLLDELEERKRSGMGFDASGLPRILYAPMISGVENANLEMVTEMGGTLVMSDLEHMGFLEPVETRNNVLRNYASYLVGINEYSGDSNQLYAEKITQFAMEMKCDGVLFQDVFACRNLAPVLKLFKERARKAGLPVLEMSFNNIGENIEQNRTRIEAFMEMLAQ